MFTKSLVAVHFSESEIFACELDSSRKKIKNNAFSSIPNGLVSVKKVVDEARLSQFIKDFWTKNSFKTKDVSIIIPEFSTFTKLMKLPKLATSEVGEAVNWQAQEYLPNGIENMVVDWRILNKNEESTEVLMVAVPKETLMGYVDACVTAGLFPVSVEIPSVSLEKIVKCNGGFILVHTNSSKTLIVFGEDNKIFGTNIIDGTTISDISSSVSKIVKHFDKIKFTDIRLGGDQISSEIADSLKKIVQTEVKVLDPGVLANKELVQKFLVPIAMLKGPVAEPSDPGTINLLPANLVEKYQNQKFRNQIWSLTLTVTVFVWISLLVTLGSYLVLSQQVYSLKSKLQQSSQAAVELRKAETESMAINKISGDVLKIKQNSILPEVVLNQIFEAKPTGVSLTDYDLDFDKGIFELRGVSLDRQSLVAFKENLEKVASFDSVDVPISSFEEVSDLEFSVSFKYASLDKSENQDTDTKTP